MKINLHPQFKKFYKSRIAPNKKLVRQTETRITLFKDNPNNLLLKDHGLTGAKKELRAFSITGDIRTVYLPVSKGEVIFLNIGSHNQVY
jgi:mRNA-degrading endonuclease YafQ of YafQ-DinJ toxin-antitoxin module